MDRLVNLLPDLVDSVDLVLVFRVIVEAVVEVDRSESVLVFFVDDFVDLAADQGFDTGEQLHLRIEVLVLEVEAALVHLLEDRVYLILWPFLRVLHNLVGLEVPLNRKSRDLVLPSELHHFLPFVTPD